jgi:flagellar protein FliS
MYNNHSPFSPQLSNHVARSLAGAYSKVRNETGVIGADGHKLVAMLFDGLFNSLQEARGALQRGDVEVKCAALGRSARIVEEGLNAGLNLESGLEVADNLHTLYGYLGVLITKANLRSDPTLVDEAISLVMPVREAWNAITPAQRAVN